MVHMLMAFLLYSQLRELACKVHGFSFNHEPCIKKNAMSTSQRFRCRLAELAERASPSV